MVSNADAPQNEPLIHLPRIKYGQPGFPIRRARTAGS